ncbi:MAG: hypothetical protein ACOCUH_04660 [Bacteriovoracia bacterium]
MNFLKWLLIIYFTVNAVAWSQSNKTDVKELILCLADEEEYYHEKNLAGPLYELNQLLINRLATFSSLKNIFINKKYLKSICSPDTFSPSEKLFRHLILERDKLFIVKAESPEEKIILDSLIKELIDEAPDIFFNYLTFIQKSMPTSDCLTKNVPTLAKLQERMQYLTPQIGKNKAFYGGKLVQKVLKSLYPLEVLYLKCIKDQKMREKQESAAQ